VVFQAAVVADFAANAVNAASRTASKAQEDDAEAVVDSAAAVNFLLCAAGVGITRRRSFAFRLDTATSDPHYESATSGSASFANPRHVSVESCSWRFPMNKVSTAIVMAVLAVSIPAVAHHSFQAEYDQSKPLTLVGKLTKVLLENPHGWIYLDAKNTQGRTVNWALEIPAPNVVNRNGFDRSVYQAMVESGEEVTVTAYAARDGSKHAWAGGLTRADGRTVITLSGIPGQGGRRGGPPPQ